MTRILQLIGLYCRHRNTSRQFTDDKGKTYICCFDCSRRLPHELPEPIRGTHPK